MSEKKVKRNFFLDPFISSGFKAVCAVKRVSMSVIIENYMKKFVEDFKKGEQNG